MPPSTPSPQARLTLQTAFERFATTVAPDDQRVFNNTKLKDVRDEAIQIERQLRARRTPRNMARLEPFLQGIEHYSKVVEVLCNGTPYLSWVWAPVKLMLMITVDSIGAFEKLIDAYSKIADMMPRLDRLATALIDDFNFQNIMALVYSDIIEFHRRAYKLVRRKSWAIFFGSMWAGFESRFDGILRSLAYHSELVDKEAIAADIANAVRRHKEDSEKWEQQEREWEALKIRSVLSWLGNSGPVAADTLDRHIRNCLPNSCDWFIRHDKTQLWLGDSAKNTLLWLYGKPGAGYSPEGPSHLLRSIISQIVQKHQDLAIYVHDIYFKSHPVPSKKALLGLLTELLRGLGSTRLVVDGIDEWESCDQKEILKDLTQILSTHRSSNICKVLIASRDSLDISRILRKKGNVAAAVSLSDVDENLLVSRSIGQFVDSKLSDLPDHFTDLDPDALIVTDVKRTLLAKSHGMFLWVRLVLDSLEVVYSPEELRAVVDCLPSDLEALYERIFSRLCSAYGAHSHGGVQRIISFICFAQRPLHKHELLYALSVPRYGVGPDTQTIPIPSILDHCKPFVEERPDSTVVFVHFSVKEFFMRSRVPPIIPSLQSELDLSCICAITLTRGLELVRIEDRVIHLARIASGSYRLLPYALQFWIEHCSLYASSEDSLGYGCPLIHNLNRLHNKHKQLLGSINQCKGNSVAAEAARSHLNDRLGRFADIPGLALMEEALRIRSSAIQHGCEDGEEVEAFTIHDDRSLFSRMATTYENSVTFLLSQQEVEGISNATLRSFQESYRSMAFRCRYPQCDRSSLGFASQQLRTQHETIHFQRVYCKVSTCQFSRVGFVKKTALNAHTRKYHGESATLPIPPRVRRSADNAEESGPAKQAEARSDSGKSATDHQYMLDALNAQDHERLAMVRKEQRMNEQAQYLWDLLEKEKEDKERLLLARVGGQQTLHDDKFSLHMQALEDEYENLTREAPSSHGDANTNNDLEAFQNDAYMAPHDAGPSGPVNQNLQDQPQDLFDFDAPWDPNNGDMRGLPSFF